MKTRTRTTTKVAPKSPQPSLTTTLERHSISPELTPSQVKSFSSANGDSNRYSHNLSHISPFRPASRQIIISGERDSKALFEQLETKNFSQAIVQPRSNSFISQINSLSATNELKIQGGWLKKTWNKAKGAVSKGFDWVAEKIVKPIKRAAERLLNSLKQQGKRFVNKLKSSAKGLLGKAKQKILNFIRKIQQAVKKLILKARKLANKVITKAKRYAMKVAKQVGRAAKKLLSHARNLASKYAQKMLKLTHYFLKIGNPQKAQKLIQNLNQFAGKIVDWATKKIMGLVRRATAIVTKVMQQATRQLSRLIQSAAGGVQRLVKQVTSATQKLINGAIQRVENLVRQAGNITQLFNQIKGKLNGILGPARGKANWLIDSMMKAADGILRGFLMPLAKQAGSWMRSLLRPAMKLVSGMLNKATAGITRGIKAATNKLTQSMQWLIGSIKKLLELYVEKVLKAQLQLGATIVKRVIDGVIKAIEKIILEPLKAFFEFMTLISQILAKAAGVIDKILAHPVNFIKNLFSGVKQGLSGFVSRIGIHLEKGLQTFLFGPIAETGVEIPKTLDLSGLLTVVAQLSGLSYNRIRERAAGKLGEEKVAFLEGGVSAIQNGNLGEFAQEQAQSYADNQMAAVKEKAGPLGRIVDIFKLLREGPSGIVKYFQELDFNSLITGIIGEIKEYLIQEIVQKAVIQVVAYLTPGAGWLKAAIDALRVMYALFIQRAQQVKEILDGFTDSIVNIAKRAIAPAVKRLEGALGKSLPVLIGVLADYLGIGGIPQKIQGFIKKGQKWVDANVLPIIDKILDKIAAIFAKLPSMNVADYLPRGMGMGKERLYAGLRKSLSQFTNQPFENFEQAQTVVNSVGETFKFMGLNSLNLEPAKEDHTGHTYNVIAMKLLPGRKPVINANPIRISRKPSIYGARKSQNRPVILKNKISGMSKNYAIKSHLNLKKNSFSMNKVNPISKTNSILQRNQIQKNIAEVKVKNNHSSNVTGQVIITNRTNQTVDYKVVRYNHQNQKRVYQKLSLPPNKTHDFTGKYSFTSKDIGSNRKVGIYLHGLSWWSVSQETLPLSFELSTGDAQVPVLGLDSKSLKKPSAQQESKIRQGEVTASSLNVRENAGTQFKTVGDSLSRGKIVNIYEEKNGWYRIGNKRWVSGKYVYIASQVQQNSQKAEFSEPNADQKNKSTVKPNWLSIAEGEIGIKEIKGNKHNRKILEYHQTTGKFSDDETPWCSSFVNWVMEKAGYKGTGSAKALSWQNWGKDVGQPVYGSIAVFSWGGGKGHVGFVVGKSGNNISVLGGNQKDQVNVSTFSTSKIVAYVVPKNYSLSNSAYNLENIKTSDNEVGNFTNTR
jgi:uncharacterized protein (TIGR02594 family)